MTLLLHHAIGDAYGASFEFSPPQFIAEKHTCKKYVPNHSGRIELGKYTDDTQMAFGVTETLLEGNLTRESFAEKFVTCYKRDPRNGYAGRFQKFLDTVESGSDFLDRIQATSDRNGAAMRSTPIGLLPSISRILEVCETQARITHDTEGGIVSSQATALIVHFFRYGLGKKEELPDFLESFVGDHTWDKPWKGSVPCHGIKTVRAALTAILRMSTLQGVLRQSVAFGGDVDTVAAIGLAAASLSPKFKKNLSKSLYTGLENGPFGRDYILEMDQRLLQIRVPG